MYEKLVRLFLTFLILSAQRTSPLITSWTLLTKNMHVLQSASESSHKVSASNLSRQERLTEHPFTYWLSYGTHCLIFHKQHRGFRASLWVGIESLDEQDTNFLARPGSRYFYASYSSKENVRCLRTSRWWL